MSAVAHTTLRLLRQAAIPVIAAIALLTAPQGKARAADDSELRVNSVVVDPTPTIDQAEAAAKRQALRQAVGMRGNLQLRDSDVREIMENVDRLVRTRHILNVQAVNGLYQPAFYLSVDMGGINAIIRRADATEIVEYGNPRFQVAIIISRLPKLFGDPADREIYIDDINETVKEYYGRAGFPLVDFLNIEGEELYEIKRLRSLERRIFDPMNPPTAIDYYLLGQLDIPDDAVTARDGGAYYRTHAKLQIKLLDLNSGQPVSSRRTVEGTGSSARESVDDAVRNIVKAVQEKASAPDILRTWQRNIERGMKYEITVCDRELKYDRFDDLLAELRSFGGLSGGKSGQVPLYVFQFPGGRMVAPARAFEAMLEEIKSRTGKYGDTEVRPIIYNKHKVFMFGNTSNCFGGGTGPQAVQ